MRCQRGQCGTSAKRLLRTLKELQVSVPGTVNTVYILATIAVQQYQYRTRKAGTHVRAESGPVFGWLRCMTSLMTFL